MTFNRIDRRIRRRVGLLVLIAASSTWPVHAPAAPSFPSGPAEYRLLQAAGSFADTSQFTVAYRFRGPPTIRAHHLELALGTIWSPTQTGAVVSFGPVWRLPLSNSGQRFLDFGFSPTLVSGTDFGARDLGGHLHFTSSLAIGARFGRTEKYSISLRAQHTSNGGLHNNNPGLDMLGLTFAIEFRD